MTTSSPAAPRRITGHLLLVLGLVLPTLGVIGYAVVLFGSRVLASDLVDGNFSRPLIRNGVPEDFVLDLATDLRVLLS